mgnify:CR=1 FL=1
MGRFISNVQIKYNKSRMEFKNSFCDLMKKRGLEPCGEDEAVWSYLLAFSNGGWVTLLAKDYSENPKKADEDSEQAAAVLNTSAFSVEVVDSDFALLRLNAQNGGKDDVIVGDGSGYGIEEPARGTQKLWEPLLAEGRTCEQFSKTVAGNDVFVEDALGKFALLLGIDPQFIAADYRDLSEITDDGNITALYFKKMGAGKPMTLNTAFKKVFGEALEPLGFQLIKGRYPYFVRVVPGGEIIHIITLLNETTNQRGKKCFKIFGGIATVYRDEIDLSKNPWDENVNWMRSNSDISNANDDIKYDFAYEGGFHEFLFTADDENEMLYDLNHSLDVTRKVLLPVISKAVDIDSAIRCFSQMGMPLRFDESFECLLLLKTPRYANIFMDRLQQRADEYKQKMEQGINEYTPEECEKRLQRANQFFQREISLIENVLNDPELLARYTAELERRKAQNTEILRSYGLSL